jgi:DNA-binding MarR family transcriptional regulator
MRWRKRVDRELEPLGLTFTRWLVLESTLVSIRQQGDAVSQSRVCDCAELDKVTVSHVMQDLEQAGLVDRGPDAFGPGYRVFVTARGAKVAAAGRLRVEAVSEAEG